MLAIKVFSQRFGAQVLQLPMRLLRPQPTAKATGVVVPEAAPGGQLQFDVIVFAPLVTGTHYAQAAAHAEVN